MLKIIGEEIQGLIPGYTGSVQGPVWDSGVEEKVMENFLSVTKLTIGKKTILSGRGCNKEKREIVNFVRIMFPHEHGGTFYFRREKENYVISQKILTETKLDLKRMNNGQRYFNVRNLFDTSYLYYQLTKKNGEYFFHPIEAENIADQRLRAQRGKSGKVAGQGINICKKDMAILTHNNTLSYFDVHIETGDRPYISICGCETKLPDETLRKICPNEAVRYETKTINYKVNAYSYFYIPRFFAEKTGIKKGDMLDCHLVGDKLIIEAPDVFCDICHKPIKRYEEQSRTVCRCEDCNAALERFEGIERNSKEDLLSTLHVYEQKLDHIIYELTEKEKQA